VDTAAMAAAAGMGYPPPPGARDALPRHPLLEKGTYEQLQRNGIVETRPHILHFGGFQIHKEHSHTLRILNISPTSLRVTIIGPSTPHFRLSFDKKGLLAPGMSEEIAVLFTPHEWRYYYDTVKIFCGDMAENLVVPIHAYPSANDIALPRIIDFGRVAIGTSRTKVVPLACKIPLQFEFEITVLEEHPDFQVSPLAGIIPPDGAANVSITFFPTRHRTARAELQFNVAQFDWEPVTVSIVGSSAPDIAKDELLKNAQFELAAVDAQRLQDAKTQRSRKVEERKSKGPIEVKRPAFPVEDQERTIDGVKVPTSRIDKHATNFVLNQTAGKLPLKDLVSFIKDQREAAQDRMRRATELDTGDEEAEEEQMQALELRFEMLFREIAKHDREKELRSETARGEDLFTPAEIQNLEEARKQRHARIRENLMRNDVARVESVLSQGHAAVPSTFKPAVNPQWDENSNDTFSVRLQVIDRFLRAGSTCLMRTRAEKRAKRLREAMTAANVVDRESCRAWVDAENRAAASRVGGAQQGTGLDAAAAPGADDDLERLELIRIPAEGFVLPPCLPTRALEVKAEEREEREVPPVGDFREFLPEPLNVRLDYKVMAYEKYSYTMPPSSSYMALHKDTKRLDAAREEHLVRGPRGEADATEVPLAMPESCLLPPAHDALSLLVPSTECRTYVAYPEATECDPEYRLEQPPPLLEPLKTEPLLPPDIMSLEGPWLEAWRQRRQISDPFQFSDPLPCSFAEAGGSLGARAGCDAGGERLAFLPVGGYARDIPSDTDDDNREDFEMPPPTDDEYQKALHDMEGSVNSELWRKEEATEERLRRLCDVNNSAVRERLIELNQDLDCANKLFLG